jgi:branched-chain amino acid transport system substrate-binding protein
LTRRRVARGAATLLVAAGLAGWGPAAPKTARAADPIKIGFGMALTGGLAAVGKTGLLAMQIWEADTNAKGGLLGRPVKLVFYDDQSSPSTVPGIYTKLLDVDKVDFVVSGYATNQVAPAIPVVMAADKVFLGLFALDANGEFRYPKYFSMLPTGSDPKVAFSKGFFDAATHLDPKPKTLAIVGADAEFAKNAIDGARLNAKDAGFNVVYDKTYPPPTTDFTPIVRAIQATNPDVVYIASYPPDSVGMVRAINEVGLKARLMGGGMVGVQITAIKTQLGPMLNGFTSYDWWVPSDKMKAFPGVQDFLKKYQAQAPEQGVDPLGYYLPIFAYSYLQVLGDAITATKGLDQDKIADYIRANSFNTLAGDIRFGKNGEWEKPRVLMVQYHNIKGSDVDQFRTIDHEVVFDPTEYKTGNVAAPFVPEGKK